jgi:hypothetical protein
MTNWWYWQWQPSAPATTVLVPRFLPPAEPSRPADPVTDRLQEAAAARRKAGGAAAVSASSDDYWTPQRNLPSSASPPSIQQRGNGRRQRGQAVTGAGTKSAGIDLTVPLLMGIVSAGIVGYNGEGMTGGSGVQEHFGGAVALGVVNSFEMKVMLAGLTWFIIGSAIASLVHVLGTREEDMI